MPSFAFFGTNARLDIEEAKFIDPTNASGSVASHINPATRFLVANDLSIYDSSSLQATLQLFQKNSVGDMSDLDVETKDFGSKELSRLIARTFSGSQDDILKYCFAESDEKGDDGKSGPAAPGGG